MEAWGAVGLAQEGKGARAGLRESEERRQAGPGIRPTGRNGGKRGRGKIISFFKAIFQIHFQKILNFFSILVKTNHHINKSAAT